MEIDVLRTFQSVARLNSISKTAEQMYLSVSTVTGRIKSLEEELGKPLFVREGRRIQLTEEGTHFVNSVERFLEILEDSQEKLSKWRKAYTGELNLAVNITFANYIFPKLLVRFRELYPHIRIKLIAANNEEIMQMVNQGEVELGITDGWKEEAGMVIRPWFNNQVIPVVHKHHPLFGKPSVSTSELRSCSFLNCASVNEEQENISHWFEKSGLYPHMIMEINHIEIVKRLMEQMEAISFLPRISILEELAEKKFGIVHLHVPIIFKRQANFIYRQKLDMSLAVKTFIEYSYQHVSDLFNLDRVEEKPVLKKLRPRGKVQNYG